jgi:hypothetical protein
LINIGAIALLQFVTLSCQRKNYIRKLVAHGKWELIYGQLINVMAPLVLPWLFVIAKAGVRDFRTKINTAAYFFTFFVCLTFSIYYFVSLLTRRKIRIR